jgi:hypothetical protein
MDRQKRRFWLREWPQKLSDVDKLNKKVAAAPLRRDAVSLGYCGAGT